jgi:hypothetical protein
MHVVMIVAMTMVVVTIAVFMDMKVDMIFFVPNFSDGNFPRRTTTTSASAAHDI